MTLRAAVLLGCLSLTTWHPPVEAAPAVGPPAPGDAVRYQPETATPSADDPWGFDEEPEETWRDILTPQIPDLLLVGSFLVLALISFVRKSVVLRVATLLLAVGYLGFAKSLLISVVNVFGVIGWEFPVFRYNLAWYLLAVFTVVSTVLWGRLYCGRICAFGALTQLMDWVVPARWRFDVPARYEDRAMWVKYVVLAATVGYFVATQDMTVYRYVEPFWMFGLTASAGLWTGLALLLVATVFVRNLYCRFLCPLGAALGVLSLVSVFRIKRWSECSTCRICEKACEYGAIRGPKILVTECVRCDDCERLYDSEAVCPHWRILAYRARRSAGGGRVSARGARPA